MMEVFSPWINPKLLKKCFIAAPAGLDLKALPDVLSERDISWEWAREATGGFLNPLDAIRSADFLIGIFTGTRRDYHVFYDVGIAVGMGKPVFLITKGHPLPFDLNQFPINKIPLTAHSALALHLDIFLRVPERESARPDVRQSPAVVPQLGAPDVGAPFLASALERRVYDIIEASGGRAISEPDASSGTRYRPDFLAWLGNQDAELLDPTVIEIKERVHPRETRRLEERLLAFMQSAGIRTAFVLTAQTPPRLLPRLSPYVFWLSLDDFERLARQARLGTYVRETRNRVVHGLRDATF